MSESQVFQVGDRVTVGRAYRAADEDRCGGLNTMTRFADDDLCTPGTGTVTDVFQGPVSGVWLYVVDGTGYTENELRPVPESRKVTDESIGRCEHGALYAYCTAKHHGSAA
jgi:hypothetical protein